MAFRPEERFCVLAYYQTESLVAMQLFWCTYRRDPPSKPSILHWYKYFVNDGYVCKGNCTSRASMSEEL
jgi:hypothetical protein